MCECIKYRVCLSNKSNKILPKVAVDRIVHSWECLLRALQLYNKMNRENTLHIIVKLISKIYFISP